MGKLKCFIGADISLRKDPKAGLSPNRTRRAAELGWQRLCSAVCIAVGQEGTPPVCH